MITLILDYPVSANRYWRQVVINGHPASVRSTEAKHYIEAVGWAAKSAGIRAPIAGRVRVDLALFPPRPQDWARRARLDPDGWSDSVKCVDLDNARKVIYDALKEVVIEDDRWIHQDSGERMPPDDGGARVEVRITPLGPRSA